MKKVFHAFGLTLTGFAGLAIGTLLGAALRVMVGV
jgi:hypothetical protein